MAENLFPRTISGFTEYIKIAYAKLVANMSNYSISAEKLSELTPFYNVYLQAEEMAANPDTATTGARRARNDTRKALETVWRKFLNENIRFNSAVSQSDLEVFRIKERDTIRTPIGVPNAVPVIAVKTVGARRMEIEVLDSATGKKKKPEFASGSYIYVAVTEAGQLPQHIDEYRKVDFSSNCHHVLEFPLEQLAKQANIHARYANAHGKEGPQGADEAAIIG